MTNFSTIYAYPYLTTLSSHTVELCIIESSVTNCEVRQNFSCSEYWIELPLERQYLPKHVLQHLDFRKRWERYKKCVTFLHNIQRICTNCFRENTKKEFSNPTLHIVCGYTPRLIDQLVLSPCSQSSETWKFYTNLHVWNHQKAESGRNLIRIFKMKHVFIVYDFMINFFSYNEEN